MTGQGQMRKIDRCIAKSKVAPEAVISRATMCWPDSPLSDIPAVLSLNRGLFLRHPGLTQAGVISGILQGTAGRGLKIGGFPKTSDARHRSFASQAARFGEFGGSVIGFAFEAIGCRKPGMDGRIGRMGAARLLEPDDRIVGARLQQTSLPKAKIKRMELGIAGA